MSDLIERLKGSKALIDWFRNKCGGDMPPNASTLTNASESLDEAIKAISQQGQWISVETKPEIDKPVLIKVCYQRMVGSMQGAFHEESEIQITGGWQGDHWFFGNKELLWDLDVNLGIVEDDINGWCELPEPPQENSK